MTTLVGAFALTVAGAVAVPVVAAAPAEAATTSNSITLAVTSARTEPHSPVKAGGVTKGDPVTTYRYMINADNSGVADPAGDPETGSGCSADDPGYPNSCDWPSINEAPGAAPIAWQGTEADFADSGSVTLPDGRYLVTVLADDYKIDGAHITLPMEVAIAGDAGVVAVEMQPNPLPDSTLRAQVFIDEASTNGAIDASEIPDPTDPNRIDVTGFQGHINDTLGEVLTDVYGNSLCTVYAGEDPVTHEISWAPNTDPASTDLYEFRNDDGTPKTIETIGGKCFADASGMLVIPHLGTNRYTTTVTPPDGSDYDWIQTTTLEGNHDFDTWLMEGSTGFDTEATVGGEPVPTPVFGFAKANEANLGGSGTITGTVVSVKQYYPPIGGSFNYYLGSTGSRLDKPIPNPVLSLNDLGNGDQAVWVGRGDGDGNFSIPNVPDGDYLLTWWDEPQNYILSLVNVTVSGGQTVDLKQLPLNGWWTQISGHVFLDSNSNGKRDNGEQGLPQFPLTLRKKDNSLMDRGSNAVTTDAKGYYEFEGAYPLAEWTVLEAYSDSFYTTGVTYQADNQPNETTVLGAGVDVSTLNIIGLSGRIDWGVQAYDASGSSGGAKPRNGGIVGSISYDTTRNELDPALAATEDWQPGIPNIPVKLHATVPCPTDFDTRQSPVACDPTEFYQLATVDCPTGHDPATVACDATDSYEIVFEACAETDPAGDCDSGRNYKLTKPAVSDGSLAKGKLLNTYTSEHWSRPTDCAARDVEGNVLTHPGQEDVLVPDQATGGECISALVQGVQFGTYASDQGAADANFGASVDGNYGFGDACLDGTLDATDPDAPLCTDGSGAEIPFSPLPADGYLVSIDVPTMDVSADNPDLAPVPMYQVTSEEDINVARGDTVVPQVPPPSCAGPMHTVDVDGIGINDGYPEVVGDGTNGVPAGVIVPESTPVVNPPFVDMGGSPYEGSAKRRCDTKLVELNNGKSIVPMFHLFTDVPVPSRLRGLIVDDLNFQTDKRAVLYGDKAGVANAPVGIYDYTGRLVFTAESDFNGFYDVLMPSTDHISCPTPSGVCTNLYRFVGNDPGAPGHLNANYNPRFRTIATEFEAMPGVTIPTDLAPTQVGVSIGMPGSGPTTVKCMVNPVAPQLFAVSTPYVSGSTGGDVTIDGLGFGADKGTGTVTLGSTELTTSTWNDKQIVATVPTSMAPGAYQLEITADNGKTTVNGLTFHVIGTGYDPQVLDVGPGASNPAYDPTHPASTSPAGANHAIQNAIDDAADGSLIVVHPNTATTANPLGAYYENLVVTKPVTLQGVGAGGFQGSNNNSDHVQGTVIDGLGFAGDTAIAADWLTRVDANAWAGSAPVSDGAVITLLAANNTTFSSSPTIDGFDIRGGDQQGLPANVNEVLGGPLTNLPANVSTQGGAIYAHAAVHDLQVTNNVVENNGGTYGTIRIGTPDIATPGNGLKNENVRIADNRIVQNAGTNLAGAIGLFVGSDGYQVSGNDICGNFSFEYGAGVSVYGLSPNGSIDHNRITLNNSNDEGAGIMIAGQLPADPSEPSEGAGHVEIDHNAIQANLANDDGGGIRFLMAGTDPMDVHDNIITSNVSTHEGGGIGINDAPDVRIYDNTIMNNLTTATAVTSNGQPAPAGVATSLNSDQLQAQLPNGAPNFSNPLMFDNILWDNRAGTRAGTTVTGIGLTGDATAVDNWDVGVAGSTTLLLHPVHSVVQQDSAAHDYVEDPTNATSDPTVVEQYQVSVSFATWRQNPAFVDSTLVATEQPPDLMGDYHLQSCPANPSTPASSDSPACGLGAATAMVGADTVTVDSLDIDGDTRSTTGPSDAGADEVTARTLPPAGTLQFSTAGDGDVPGLTDPDDANIYTWDSSAYSTAIDATATPWQIPATAGVDGFSRLDADGFYMSFNDTTVLPGGLTAEPEDVVFWTGSAWEMWFDGSTHGLQGKSLNINAITVTGEPGGDQMLYFATWGNKLPAKSVDGTPDDADIYSWDGAAFSRVWDASEHGVPDKARVDGSVWRSTSTTTDLYLSFSTNTTVPDVGPVEDEDVVHFHDGTWSTYFNGTAHGLTKNDLDVDAFWVPEQVAAP